MMNCSDVQLGLSQNNVAGISLKVDIISNPMLVVRYKNFHVFAIVGTAFQTVAMICLLLLLLFSSH